MILRYIRKTLVGFLSNQKISTWVELLVFVVGMLIYLVTQVFLVAFPVLSRAAPVETDDAYTYLLKAAEMQDCFLQDCPALNDLRLQLSEQSADPEINWLRYREYVRAFSVYHPLHSFVIVGLHQVGFSWEAAYNIIVMVVGLMITLAVIYWLSSMYGIGAAGIAGLLLAFTVFPNQGLYYIVPSNLALGIAIFTWGLLLKQRCCSQWVVLIGTLALVTMHPIGRLYALVTVGLHIFQNWKQLSRKTWIFSGVSISIVALSFLLPLVISRPYLSFPADPPPANWESWMGYYNNITSAVDFTKPWFTSFGGLLPASLLILVGLFSFSRFQNRSQVLTLTVLLAGLLFASLFQVLPRYPAESFSRVWIPFAILMTGAVAQAIWRWASALLFFVYTRIKNGLPDLTDDTWVLSISGWGMIFFLVSGIGITQIFIDRSLEGRREILAKQSKMIAVQNSLLEPSQPELLLSSDCGSVLYLDEVPMHFYLVHGALKCGAIYYPALAGTPLEHQWVYENQKLNYIVSWNPVVSTRANGGGTPLVLSDVDLLEIHLPEHWSSESIYIYLENPDSEVTLEVSQITMDQKEDPQEMLAKIALPANWSGWYEIDTDLDKNIQLGLAQSDGQVFLRGIRSNRDAARNWPWNEGVLLSYHPGASGVPSREIRFDTTSIFSMPNKSLELIDDSGDTILVNIRDDEK